MMMSKWAKKILIFALFGMVMLSVGTASSVSAMDKNTILSKAVYQGIYTCAQKGAYAKNINLASSLDGFYASNKAHEVKLPYYFTQFNSNVANCKKIMTGDGQGNTFGDVKLKGVMPIKHTAFNWNAKEAVDYFTGASHDGVGGIGYKLKDGQINNGTLTGFKVEAVQSGFPIALVKGLNNNNGAGLKLAKLDSKSDLGLTQQETFDLYSHYLVNVYGVPFACEGDQNYNNYSGLKDEIKVDGKTCKYKLSDAKNLASSVFGVNEQGFFNNSVSAKDVFNNVKEMAESGNVKTGDLVSVMAGADTDSSDDSSDSDSEPTCEASGAGASLGWILCPILNRLSSAAEGLYNFVSPYLEVDPQLLTGGDDGVRTAWETFRNMANILFIIVLLIVIFSQITGVGIDNYGIKKILPKLIVAAVLINLSYLICLLFVDLSNIVGNGLLSLFNGLPPSEVASNIEGIGWNATGWGLSFLSVGLITAFGAGALIAIISNPAILISLLVTALGIVISIFFLFILLAAREVAIVILVVISPLAFACMMLPNTKKLFSKWLKMGEGMLLLYPICGLLIGAGNFVSRLMMTSDTGNVGFVSALTAMLVGIVPIFFIPSLLRSSFAAMGGIGARISSFGNRMRSGATSRVRGSGAYKNIQTRGSELGLRRRAGIDADGNAVRMGRFRTMLRGGSRGRENLMRQYAQAQSARNERERMINGEGFASMSAGLEAKADQQRVSDIENLMAYGRVKTGDGNDVNVNNPDSLERFHAEALEAYSGAKNKQEKDAAMARIKAAQNYLSKSDAGRGIVQRNLEQAVLSPNSSMWGAASDAASHLKSNFGDLYKQKNRGADAMISDLASGKNMGEVARNIANDTYSMWGADKYDQGTLVGADDAALKNMSSAVESITNRINSDGRESISEDDLKKYDSIRGTAARAIEMYDDGKLSIKPEALRQIEAIAGISARGSGSNSGGTVEGNENNLSNDGNELRIRHDSRRDVPQNIGGDSGADSVSE